MNATTKKYLWVGGGIATLALGTFAYFKISKSVKQKAAAKAVVKGGNKVLGINIPDIAKQIGLELGTAYPWYDPRSATENDDAARILVLKVPKPYIPQLVSEYKKQYPGRNLETDLRKLLDGWETVSYLFVG